MTSHRTRVADFWDDHLARWMAGEDVWTPELTAWFDSYQGAGSGAVDLSCYPDPYVGDLRGLHGEPKVVVLGLNPGIGYPELQGREHGNWAHRIRASNYSTCMNRAPFGDPAWLALHGKESPYWNRLMKWARLWTEDSDLPSIKVLNFELYPWHSNGVTAPICPPADLIDRYVWQPTSEVDVNAVFAFGKPWFGVCQDLGLPVLRWFGNGHEEMPGFSTPGWNVVVFDLPSGQRAVVSWQQGFAGPPGPKRIATLQEIVGGI